METESEPYVRLASLRQLHLVVAQLGTYSSLAETLQTIADGVIGGLGFEVAAVHFVRPEGDLVVAAVAGSKEAEAMMAGRVGSRAAWDRWLSMGEAWGTLRFIPHAEGWVLDEDDVPQWRPAGPGPLTVDGWHPGDRLFAPLYASEGELVAVLSVGRPNNGQRPGAWGREALQLYSSQAAIALSNARLRSNVERALARLEREHSALRASEESFRQTFEYAPSGLAVAEMGGDQHGRLIRINDTLCRLLGHPASVMRRYSFSDIVHPDDIGTLLRTSAEGGRAELRLARRDGSYIWVSMHNSVVADTADGPRFLLTHVEDIDERKRHELELAHRASHDPLTGLHNAAELRARLSARLCAKPTPPASGSEGGDGPANPGENPAQDPADGLGLNPYDYDELGMPRPSVTAGLHAHLTAPEDDGTAGSGLAVLFCDLDGMYVINHRYGFRAGDAVLVEVARRLSGVVGDQDTVARVGGDEFVVLAESQGAADAQDLAVRLREAIIPPIAVGDVTVEVDASLGLAWAACGDSAEDVLKAADLRMYEEKRARERARRGQTASETAAPEPGIVPWPPARATGAWVPQRPPVQRQFVRTWQTEGAAAPAPPGTAEIGSTEALSHLAGTSHIHRVVCRGDVADLSPLSLLPSLRTLVIAGNSALSDLAALDGCPKLRSLDVSGCERLTDWSAVARSGIVFLTVSCAPSAVPRLSGLVGARRLRELRLLTDVDGGGVDRGSLNSDTRSGETASGQSGHGQSETGIDLDALHAIPRLRINLNPRAPSG